MNHWKLEDGIQCADTLHVKLRLHNVESTEYVKTRRRFWIRMKKIFTEDNIIYLSYLFGLLVIFLSLVAWPWDPDPLGELAPPPPPAAPSPPPPQIMDLLSPPMPLEPPIAPPPPPAAWVAIQLAQQSISLGELSGEYATIDSINETLPEYLFAAANAQNSSYNDLVSFTRTEQDSTLFYRTYEDAPLWVDQLPEFFDNSDPPRSFAVIFRTGCFPNLASQYSMTDTGVIQYQPEANVHGQDFMTYYGLVAESVALARDLVNAELVDCDNKVEGMCVTFTMLANIVVDPRNDPPVAAGGSPTLEFTSNGDFIILNTVADPFSRNNLPPPQRLIRELVGSDVDGDLLRYTITGPPQHGHAEIIEENRFFYVPEPNYTGADYFQYTVDDSRSNDAKHVLFDQAVVVVQVGFADGLPNAVPSKYWILEDNVLVGKLSRTPALFSLVPTLSYLIVTPPNFGTVSVLCGGMEAVNESCAYAPGNAFFEYTPDPNFFGDDSFTFGVVSSSFPDQVFTNVVDVEVRPVNDVPVMQNVAVDAVMNRGKNIYSFADADIQPLAVTVSDVDNINFTLHLHRIGGPKRPVSPGRFFKRLDAFGRPTDEIDMNAASQLGVEVSGGTFQAYYMAPPLARGLWTEQYAMRARDGNLVSNSSTLTINVKCSPGFIAPTDAFGNTIVAMGLCEACPLGSISSGLDAAVCSKCPRGMSSGDTRAGQCQLCPVGTYADVEGLVFCKTCPVGSTSSMGASSINDCYCREGYYGLPGNCRPCPNLGRFGEIDTWTYCAEDDLRVPLPQPGFYIVQSAKPAEEPVAIRQCFPSVACPGMRVSASDPLVDDVAVGDWRADRAQCAPGYTNEGCDTCEEGYFRLNARCEECPPTWQPVLFGIFMWCLILFGVLAPWFIRETSVTYHLVVSVMTIITYSQDIAIFGRYYLGWAETGRMRALLKWAFLFQLNPEILSLECTHSVDFVERWRSLVTLPAIIGFLAGGLMLAYFIFFGGQHALMDERTERIRSLQKTWVGCMRSVISLGIIMYAGLTVTTLDMFVFHKSVTDGRDYLRAAPALRFGLMDKSSTWYQLLPGAVFSLIVYPLAMLFSLMFTFVYVAQRWKKLWVRDLVGFSTYAYRDELFFFRVIELLRFLCFALIQLIAFSHDESGGVNQALSALVVIAVSMSLLITRPYKRYRKKLLEFVILFSHGLVLLMSALSLAPVTTDISQESKDQFAEAVFGIVVLTYIIIIVDVVWSVFEEFPMFQQFESTFREYYKRFVLSCYTTVRLDPPSWAMIPYFDEKEPMKSFFKPSTVAALQGMARKEKVSGADWTTKDRCAFAKAIQALLRHRAVESRLALRDGVVISFPKLFTPQVREPILGSAVLEDATHNRMVMTFAEKRLLRIMSSMTHRRFYRRIQKKLKSEAAINPLLEEWLKCKCKGIDDAPVCLSGHQAKTLDAVPSVRNLKVDPKVGAKFARGSDADDAQVIDLDWESEQYAKREYDGRVYFCRHEGYFDDLHREWDKMDELDQKKSEAKDALENAMNGEDADPDDVEGGAILPWHFLYDDVDDEEHVEEEHVEEELAPDDQDHDDDVENNKLGIMIVAGRQRSIKKGANTHSHTHTRSQALCCMRTCQPGQVCVHGNRMPAEVENGGPNPRPTPPKWQVTVPVSLEESSQEVKLRVLDEIRHLRDNGAYDGDEGAEPEVLKRNAEDVDLKHRASVVKEPVTMGEARLGWKVDVTLEANRGPQARTVATLLLRDDLSQMQRDMLKMQLRESKRELNSKQTNVVNRYTTREITRTIYKDAGEGARAPADDLRANGVALIGSKQTQTVKDLREVAADMREIPFERTILRYRDARGKEIINDAATLERKKVFTVNEVTVEAERDDPFYVYHEVRTHYAFFEAVFRVYASIQIVDDVRGLNHRHTTTALLMSMPQFTQLFTGCDVGAKLNNPHHDGLRSTLEAVFRSVKDRDNCAAQMELFAEQESELAGSLAPSKFRRLAQRVQRADALAFDEFVTATVLLAWLVYGFRVPQSGTRGVARALRFFVERVMRVKVVEMHAAHELLLQFASARGAEGSNVMAAKDALVVYRHFTRDNPEGMSLKQWLECVEWLVTVSVETKKYGTLLFYTHVGAVKSEPAWIEEGCRRGKVAPVGDEDALGALLLKFPRFQVAFAELCYRAEAHEGGVPSARQVRAFRRAMQRDDLAGTVAAAEEAAPGPEQRPDKDERVLRMYDSNYRSESSEANNTNNVNREVVNNNNTVVHHHHHHYGGLQDGEEPAARRRPPRAKRGEEEEEEEDDAWRGGSRRVNRVTRNVVTTTTNNIVTNNAEVNNTVTNSTEARRRRDSDEGSELDAFESWAPRRPAALPRAASGRPSEKQQYQQLLDDDDDAQDATRVTRRLVTTRRTTNATTAAAEGEREAQDARTAYGRSSAMSGVEDVHVEVDDWVPASNPKGIAASAAASRLKASELASHREEEEAGYESDGVVYADADFSTEAVAARKRRIIRKETTVTVTTHTTRNNHNTTQSSSSYQNTTTASSSSAANAVVNMEIAERKARAARARGKSSMFSSFQEREEDAFVDEMASSDDSGSEDEKIGTQSWMEQQERRRNKYRIATVSPLYDVEAIRLKRIEQDRIASEFAENERRRLKEAEENGGFFGSGGKQKQQKQQNQQKQQLTTKSMTTITTSTTKRTSASHHHNSSSHRSEDHS